MAIDATLPTRKRRDDSSSKYHLKPSKQQSSYATSSTFRRPNRRADVVLIVILVVLSAISAVYCIYSTSKLLNLSEYHKHMDHVLNDHLPHSPVKVDRLELESRFQKSVKSCLPTLDASCASYKEEHNVALVAPPGEFGDYIFTWANSVVKEALLGSTTHMHINLVSHVPPFGENTGFTKIIRILPETLLLGASDALRGTLTLGTTQQVLRLEDLQASMRQLLRFHCRISQMASHTAVLTLDMASVRQSPRIVAAGLLNFLNITAHDHGEVEMDEELELREDSEDGAGYHTATEDDLELTDLGMSLQMYASSLLTWIQKNEHVQVKRELNKVLQEEMVRSDNFTKCESFWTTGQGPKQTDLSVFTRRLATSLVPDCSSGSGNNCPHARDVCEERGDYVCNGAPEFPMVETVNRVKNQYHVPQIQRLKNQLKANQLKKKVKDAIKKGEGKV